MTTLSNFKEGTLVSLETKKHETYRGVIEEIAHCAHHGGSMLLLRNESEFFLFLEEDIFELKVSISNEGMMQRNASDQEEMQRNADALCPRVQEDRVKNDKAMRDQSPTNFMSNELNTTSKETIQEEFAENSPAVSRAKETFTSASSVAQALPHELAESQRNRLALADAGETGSNPLVTQPSSGSLDEPMKKVLATATTNPLDSSSSFFHDFPLPPRRQSMRTDFGYEAPPPHGYTSHAYSLFPPETSHGDGQFYGSFTSTVATPTQGELAANNAGGYAHGYVDGYASGYQAARYIYAGGYSDVQRLFTGSGVPYSDVPSSSNYPSNHFYQGVHQPTSFSGYGSTQGYHNAMYQGNLYGSSGGGYGSYGYDSRTNGRGCLSTTTDNTYSGWGRGNNSFFHVNEGSNADGLDVISRGPREEGTENQKGEVEESNVTDAVETEGNTSVVAPDREQYNQEDFPVDYANAKFFIIKSYGEDDVHKSIKYNVWASTRHGNTKLNAAYHVNASGQFVGLAEMTGPVDFDTNVEYWQQDKWKGSFPLKWHIVKDVPNSLLKNITLENNEYSPPVTISRDTQEVVICEGLNSPPGF